MSKITAKEYLLQEENCSKDIIQVIEDFAALRVKEEKEDAKERLVKWLEAVRDSQYSERDILSEIEKSFKDEDVTNE